MPQSAPLDLAPLRAALPPYLHRYLPTLISTTPVGILRGERTGRGDMLQVPLATAVILLRDGLVFACEKCTVRDADHLEVHGEPPEVAMTFHPRAGTSWASLRRQVTALES